MEQLRASVKGLITQWEKGGMTGVKIYLDQMTVFEDTWVAKIKTLIDSNKIKSADEEIRLISFNLDLKNKLYNPKIFDNGHRKNT